MARLSRKERARRQAIAQGLRRYWWRVHRVSVVLEVPIKQARREVKTLPAHGFLKALEARQERGPQVEAPREGYTVEIAFNLRDVSERHEWRLGEKLTEHADSSDDVTWIFEWTYEDQEGETAQTIETGSNLDEWWSNYFAGARAVMKRLLEFIGLSPQTYEGLGLYVLVPVSLTGESPQTEHRF